MTMEIRLTCKEIHRILGEHVAETYKVKVLESFSHKNSDDAERKYGHVNFSFVCEPLSAPKVETDRTGTERRLETDI